MSTPRFALPKLLLTSVRRDYRTGQSESQGGLFTVDFAGQEVRQLVDWSSPEVDFRGRGIAYHAQEIYLAAARELFVYGRDFQVRRSYESSYLVDCQAVFRLENHLYLLSGGNDCIVAFDLERQGFFWATHLAPEGDGLQCRVFDPLGIEGPGGANGPPAENRLGLNSLWADARGLFVSGTRSHGMWHVAADRRVRKAVDMPKGIHDARPFRDGVLFNDSEAGAVRFASRDGEEKAFAVPAADDAEDGDAAPAESTDAFGPLARGLCVLDEHRFAAGSSPSMVSLYDLESGSRVASVRFSSDPRYAINALEVWPFD